MVATPGQNPAYRPSAQMILAGFKHLGLCGDVCDKKKQRGAGFLCFAVDSGWNGAKRRVPEIYAGRHAPAR